MPAKIQIDEEWFRVQYETKHRSYKDIAAELGCGESTVAARAAAIGIRTRPKSIQIDPNWLRHQYITLERSGVEIASELGCGPGVVYKNLRSNGIASRPPSTCNSPEKMERMFAANRGRTASPETRKKMSDARRGMRFSKETCARISAAKRGTVVSHATRKKIGKANRGKKLSERAKEKLSELHRGENHYNWKGGISERKYCFKFNNALKERIRDDFGRQCYLCSEPENGKRLAIHHTDYNKNTLCNGKTWGLVPLCAPCHSKTNFNRWYWFALLNNYWLDKYISDWIEF